VWVGVGMGGCGCMRFRCGCGYGQVRNDGHQRHQLKPGIYKMCVLSVGMGVWVWVGGCVGVGVSLVMCYVT